MAHSIYEIIARKRDGIVLEREEITFVINGYVKDEIPDYQVAAWLMAVYIRGLNEQELSDLTEIMLNSGDCISLADVPGKKIDKHSTGGVGDKISFIVAPLVAACGVGVPMLSGRGLGHTGGTLDKLEAIPGMNVFLQPAEFKKVLAAVGMVICGQTDNIVPADKKLYALRDATATVSSIPLIASSIMSKKLALASDGIVLDVKTGSGAFMKDEQDAIRLCQTMVAIGEKNGRPTLGIISNMNQPLGPAVGNSLEIIEAIEALKGKGDPAVLEVTFALGYCMLRAAGIDVGYAQALEKFRKEISSGRALQVFKNFICAQGGNPEVCENYSLLPTSRQRVDFTTPQSGYIARIDSLAIGMAAIDVGAGRRLKEDAIDHGSGFVFQAKVGDKVEKNQPLVTIHCDHSAQIPAVRERLQGAIQFSQEPVAKPKIVLHLVDKDGIHPWLH